MTRWAKHMLLVVLLTAATVAHAQIPQRYIVDEPSAEEIMVDTFLARPAGLVATVAGSVVYVVSLPFALLSDSHELTARKLVVEPASYTFARPMGQDLHFFNH